MAEGLLRLSSDGFGNGWFGFIYSVFLAPFLVVFESDILAGQIANMFLLVISAYLFYSLAQKIFSTNWSLFALVLFVFHPSFLYYRIHLLAENIYIPLFLGLVLALWNYVEILKAQKESDGEKKLFYNSIRLYEPPFSVGEKGNKVFFHTSKREEQKIYT